MKHHSFIFSSLFLSIFLCVAGMPAFTGDGNDDPLRTWLEDSRTLHTLLGKLNAYGPGENDTALQIENKKRLFTAELASINRTWAGRQISFRSLRLEDVEKVEQRSLSRYGEKRIYDFLARNMGRAKADAFIREARKDPDKVSEDWMNFVMNNFSVSLAFVMSLAACERCFDTSYTYQARYIVPSPEGSDLANGIFISMESVEKCSGTPESGSDEIICSGDIVPVTVHVIYRNEKSALLLEKDKSGPVRGAFVSLNADCGDAPNVTLVLRASEK